MPWPRRVVVIVIVESLVASAACIAVSVAPSGFTAEAAAETLMGWVPLVLAGFVSRRRPANPVGCLLALLGSLPVLAGLNEAYDYGALRHPGILGDPSGILQAQQGVWVLLYLPVALLMLYFPDGRAISRGWSRVAVTLTALTVLYVFFEAATGDPYDPPFQHFGHPLGTLPGAGFLTAVLRPALSWLTSGCRPATPMMAPARLRRSGPPTPPCPSSCSPNTSRPETPFTSSPRDTSATCSKTASSTSTTSSTRCAAWQTAAPPWIPKWSPGSSPHATVTRWPASPPARPEVLALMAEGRTNISIARRLWLTERTVETHVASIMTKLGLATSDEHNRRVLAVVTYLKTRSPTGAIDAFP